MKQLASILFFLCSALMVDGQDRPNVLFILADDLGIDAIEGFGVTEVNFANTPTLDMLRAEGISYLNAWATPQCAPTRASIISGRYGINTGVREAPGNLDVSDESIFNYLDRETNDAYSTAVIGKWHISSPFSLDHVLAHGVDHFEGIAGGGVRDYYVWDKVEPDGRTVEIDEYITTHLTNAAMDWIEDQDNQPWFLWLSHVAPHSPLQRPPDGLFTINNTNTNRQLYNATIEAMDHEIGRLLNSMDEDTRSNTIIIFMGDNGTPRNVLQGLPNGHAKGSMFEGGVKVPMIVSGHGVSRPGAIEMGLTQANDIYATLIEVCSNVLQGGIHNSYSIRSSFTAIDAIERDYIYTDYIDDGLELWAVRTDEYKLIEDENGNQSFYRIDQPIYEDQDLIGNLSEDEAEILADLVVEAESIRNGWSCRDLILNGEEQTIDDCNDNVTTSTGIVAESESISIYPNPATSQLVISVESGDYTIRILDAAGAEYQNLNIDGTQIIDIETLPAGLFFVEITNNQNSKICLTKIIKQ